MDNRRLGGAAAPPENDVLNRRDIVEACLVGRDAVNFRIACFAGPSFYEGYPLLSAMLYEVVPKHRGDQRAVVGALGQILRVPGDSLER